MSITNAENFHKILQAVFAKSPLQKKKIQLFISGKDARFFEEAEEFAAQYLGYLESQNIPLDYVASSYVTMCNCMLRLHIDFLKTGRYPISQAEKAYEDVYSDTSRMTAYMFALAISQFLWSSHYEIFRCFSDTLSTKAPYINRYLEIGPGHGLFLNKAMQLLKQTTQFLAVDISPTSIDISRSIINHFYPNTSNVDFQVNDMLNLEMDSKFDFIALGEVIEHVNQPEILLKKLKSLLAPNGSGFVSTCANCPAVDHVYQFNNVGEIQDIIKAAGLSIITERILPVENRPWQEIIDKKITVNYCAIVQKVE